MDRQTETGVSINQTMQSEKHPINEHMKNSSESTMNPNESKLLSSCLFKRQKDEWVVLMMPSCFSIKNSRGGRRSQISGKTTILLCYNCIARWKPSKVKVPADWLLNFNYNIQGLTFLHSCNPYYIFGCCKCMYCLCFALAKTIDNYTAQDDKAERNEEQ